MELKKKNFNFNFKKGVKWMCILKVILVDLITITYVENYYEWFVFTKEVFVAERLDWKEFVWIRP